MKRRRGITGGSIRNVNPTGGMMNCSIATDEASDGLRTPDAVEALFGATQWIPTLEYDDSRALAVKAIWALGKIPGAEAENKLETLARSGDDILQKTAAEQLERRREGA